MTAFIHMQTPGTVVTLRRPPFVEVRDLSVREGPYQALDDVSLDIYPQEILALVGQRGAGRRTLLRNIARLPDIHDSLRRSGDILVRGVSVSEMRQAPDRFRRRFGWVSAKSILPPGTVFDLVAARAPAELLHQGGAVLKEHVYQALQEVHLLDLLSDSPRRMHTIQLSPAERTLLDLARAVVNGPEMLLVDLRGEESHQLVQEALLSLRRRLPIALICDGPDVPLRIADRVAVMEAGRLVEVGHPRRVLYSPRRPATRHWLAQTRAPRSISS